MRRVVVTGLGVVSPFGMGVKWNWDCLLASRSGIRPIEGFPVDDLACQIAGQVPHRDATTSEEVMGAFVPENVLPPKDLRKIDPFILYGIAAAQEAVRDSGWYGDVMGDEGSLRTGVGIGSGIGGLRGICQAEGVRQAQGARRVSPFFIPSCLINLASGNVAIQFGFRGPNHAVVTACATGTHAIGDSYHMVARGDADVMVAGGCEAAVCPLGVAGFAALRALSTHFNDRPTEASRPWDENHDGFVMGDGAGVLVLEEYKHAKARGAKIYAEVLGYGLSGDASHITAPAPEGEGGYRAMRMALDRACLNPEDIDYVNAHGTSTPVGDRMEALAYGRLFGHHKDKVAISSTKSAIGHLLGAAGAVEAVYSVLALQHQVVPPTLNLEKPLPEVEGFNLVPHTPQERKVSYVLSNSLGFGGTNAVLIFGACP